LNNLQLKNRVLPKLQRGQATLEYAIILILVVTMIIGGIELAATAFASTKASEAAKAGAGEFSSANVLRKNLRDIQQGYVRELQVQYSFSDTDANGNKPNPSNPSVHNDYIAYLNSINDVAADGLLDDYETVLNAIKTLHISSSPPIDDWDTTPDSLISDDEVIKAPASEDKFKALLILEQIKLVNVLPVIADHTPTLLANPSCGAGNTYDDGLPDRYLSGNGTDDQIYFFNPLPIDLASCAGVDATRGNKSKISILVGGYGQPAAEGADGVFNDVKNDGVNDDNLYVQGLPKLNQAIYGQYTKTCLNATDEYVSCNGAFAQMLLKPPGKLCLSNAASNTVDSCTADAPPLGITGYYFWGKGNVGAEFQYTPEDSTTPEFRPTFQIVCNETSEKNPNVMDNVCFDTPNLKKVQVHTRYRAVFESFLTFGLQELTDAGLAQYFFDPSNLRGLGANLGVGIAGSELGPKAHNKNVTVKQFKDFRGCYEVDVETNQVSACN